MMFRIGWLVVFVLGILVGCSKKKVMVANAPNYEGIRSYTFKPNVSEVQIPVNVSIKGIERSLNEQMKGLVYADSGLKANENITFDVKVWNKSQIRLDVKGNELYYKVPLKIWSRAHLQASILGIDIADVKEAECGIELFMKSAISIDSLWNVQTKTTLINYQWLDKPIVKIGPVELPITWVVDVALKQQKDELAKKLDESVNANFNLRPFVERAWNELQEPISISSDPELWLAIKPIRPFMTPFVGKTGKISSSVGISAYLESVLGAKPETKYQKLPALRFIPDGVNKFSISLTNDISYVTASELARKALVNREFEFNNGKQKVTITDIELYPSKDKLAVKASMIGSLNGTVYLKGKPMYDSTKQAIKLVESEFDLDSKNKLLKTADWLLHGMLEKKLEHYLIYPIGDKLKESENMIKKCLTNNRLDKNTLLNGQLVKLSPKEILMMESGIKTIVNAEGQIEIKIEGF